MINPNDPSLKSWLFYDRKSDFPIQNLPFGIFKPKNRTNPRAGTRIGSTVIDLALLAERGYLADSGIKNREVFDKPFLNDFIALGPPVWTAVRNKLSEIFNAENEEFWNTEDFRENLLYKAHEVEMLMPVQVGDYTDFYSSIEHATNVGKMFRDPDNALLPNWKHIPVGYHGRASSIVVSGTNIHRPVGQTKADDSEFPDFGPSRLVDFELELAFITGKSTQLGERIPIEQAEDYIFGLVLFNDLSARDIQKWEYVPLGPFLSKNFGSVISPWIVTLDALKPFRVEGPAQDPPPLPYLKYIGEGNFDISLEVFIQPEESDPFKICHSNFKHMYWNMFQQLAHQTVSGCNINVGDIYASGTISGPTPDSFGSMLELTWRGTKPIVMPDGTVRKFINDNDTIIMRGAAEKDGVRIGFGECRAKILPSKE
ncbi:MAG: fumarylacetoacetase [Bacteroidales bacterium]|nr:fumarylacetoacetase [Bacteroidales bacterium]